MESVLKTISESENLTYIIIWSGVFCLLGLMTVCALIFAVINRACECMEFGYGGEEEEKETEEQEPSDTFTYKETKSGPVKTGEPCEEKP